MQRASYMQSAVEFECLIPFNFTIAIRYANAHGLHQLRSQDINAPLSGTPIPVESKYSIALKRIRFRPTSAKSPWAVKSGLNGLLLDVTSRCNRPREVPLGRLMAFFTNALGYFDDTASAPSSTRPQTAPSNVYRSDTILS